MLVPPLKRFTALRTIVPVPVLLSVPVPEIGCKIVRIIPESTWNVLAGSPRLIERALLKVDVASRVPALSVRELVVAPRLASLPTLRIPPLIVVPPE